MPLSSLPNFFKNNPLLQTDISDFIYSKELGSGGNSSVFLFKKENKNFALKFLQTDNYSKTNRFKDEYFCAIQIPTHKNISQLYHFDKLSIDNEDFLVIVMKSYDHTLKKPNYITEDELADNLWKIFNEICAGLKHLHDNQITHRDLKPQNIFYDQDINEYVIGDLGIAHFDEDRFQKNSKTKKTDRMANYLFSAPEQVNNNEKASIPSDIFALGQVMHWLVKGEINRGGDRETLSTPTSPKKLILLDKIIDKCLLNKPANRFQSIAEIEDFTSTYNTPPTRNIRSRMQDLDHCIRRAVPDIDQISKISNAQLIEIFITEFNTICTPEEFWIVNADGGDAELLEIKKIGKDTWLLQNHYEIKIESITIYKDPSRLYKSFFALTTSASKQFDLVDTNGSKISRSIGYSETKDHATLWNNKYLPKEQTRNGFYSMGIGAETLKVTEPEFQDRCRNLKKYGYLIIPQGNGASQTKGRSPAKKFLDSVTNYGGADIHDIKNFLRSIEDFHATEITIYD